MMILHQGGGAKAGSPDLPKHEEQPLYAKMEQLADILACIFSELRPDQRAAYFSDPPALRAA
jgi:hypothetical protein